MSLTIGRGASLHRLVPLKRGASTPRRRLEHDEQRRRLSFAGQCPFGAGLAGKEEAGGLFDRRPGGRRWCTRAGTGAAATGGTSGVGPPRRRRACAYCADAFEATSGVEEAGVRLLDEYERHPSFRSLLHDGYQVITF